MPDEPEHQAVTTYFLLERCVELLKTANTGARHRIYSPGDWQTWDDDYPYIRVKVFSEEKESWGRAGNGRFTATGTLQFTIIVAKKAAPDDQGAARAEMLAWRLQRQVEVTLINNRSLIHRRVQQIPRTSAHDAYNSDGSRHYGGVQMELALEFIQGVEDFWVAPTSELKQVGVFVDAANVFDPTGNYTSSPFASAIKPAPRTSGPDGRAEGSLLIDLPQDAQP